jgi:chorismate mutase
LIAIRGATTINNNTQEEIKEASIELFAKLIETNNIDLQDIKAIIFSCTQDITKDYPGKFIREIFNLSSVGIMHFNEMFVENSLPKCIRVLLLLDKCNTAIIQYVYLREAKSLRKDLFNNT